MHIDYRNQHQDNAEQIKKEYKIFTNYEIFQGKVRLIQDGSEPLIIDRDKAIDIAKSKGMDLIQIAYNKNDFPHAVCKIMDYGKYKYEKTKKEKIAKKQAKAQMADIKEICFSIRIDDGDLKTKLNHISDFLSDKKTKVKISIKLSRREMNLLGMAKDLMRKILSEFEGKAELDQNPTFNSGIMSCVIRPIK